MGRAVRVRGASLRRSAGRERPDPDPSAHRRARGRQTKEPEMPLAARRVARRGVVGPRPSPAPRPWSEPRPSWPTVSTAVPTVVKTGATAASRAAAAPSVRGGRDDEESSRDRLPDQGSCNAKALAEELPPLMPDLAKAQDDLGTVHFSRFMVEGEEKLLFLVGYRRRGRAAYRASGRDCRSGVRHHLRTRGRPSNHARGK